MTVICVVIFSFYSLNLLLRLKLVLTVNQKKIITLTTLPAKTIFDEEFDKGNYFIMVKV
jgi:hypothetical protein